jgi:hypothetical protein
LARSDGVEYGLELDIAAAEEKRLDPGKRQTFGLKDADGAGLKEMAFTKPGATSFGWGIDNPKCAVVAQSADVCGSGNLTVDRHYPMLGAPGGHAIGK